MNKALWPIIQNGPIDVYSNFDHELVPTAEKALREGWVGEHCAWNYHALIWYQDGCFHEEVSVYGNAVATHSAPDLSDVINITIAHHGSE